MDFHTKVSNIYHLSDKSLKFQDDFLILKLLSTIRARINKKLIWRIKMWFQKLFKKQSNFKKIRFIVFKYISGLVYMWHGLRIWWCVELLSVLSPEIYDYSCMFLCLIVVDLITRFNLAHLRQFQVVVSCLHGVGTAVYFFPFFMTWKSLYYITYYYIPYRLESRGVHLWT